MADDSKYPKRVNYFNSQMLYDGDFRDEQKYHRSMRLVHNSSLHAWGIVSGLEVKNGRKGNEVLIGSGMAIDNQGQEIILPEDLAYPFSASNVERYLTIAYKDEPDEQSVKLNIEGEKDAYARREERPAIELLQDQPPKDGKAILLAKVKLDGSGNVSKIDGDPTKSERSRFAGLNPNTELSVRSLLVRGAVLAQQLSFANENGTSYPDNWIGMADNILDKIKWLHIGGITDGVGDARKRRLALYADNVYLSGNVGIGITDPKSSLSVKGGIAVGTTYAGTLAAPANDLLVEGKVGIGTNDPGSNALHAGTGSVRFELGTGRKLSLGGNGSFEIDKPGVVGGRFIVTEDGNVGIKTPAPNDALDVRGLVLAQRLCFTDEKGTPFPDNWIGMADNISDKIKWLTIGGITDGDGNAKKRRLALYADNVYLSANVGIGTTAPKGFQVVLPEKTEAAPGPGVTISGGPSGNASIELRNNGSGTPFIDFAQDGTTTDFNARIRLTSPDLLAIEGAKKLEVAGTVQAATFIATNPMQHRMYPSDDPIIFQDIFDAQAKGQISKCGNAQYDDTSWRSNKWPMPLGGRRIIKFGGNNETFGNGAEINIPGGYNTLWVRILGQRWNVIGVFSKRGTPLGAWAGGFRSANCYCPDGSLHDSDTPDNFAFHQWLPIPVGGSEAVLLHSMQGTNDGFWLSGLAFSKNPWNHATQSADGYRRGLNGGEPIGWNSDNFNNDVAGQIEGNTNKELKVPVVPSGRDKLLYLIEHNSNWNGCQHAGITINGQPIERFVATYDNPFARHWNSKFYCRYIAARIPAKLTSGVNFLSVRIDMGGITNSIFFREIGTHDLDVPT